MTSQRALARGHGNWTRLEHLFDSVFGGALNPLRHLGTLGFLFFWLLAISGIYLYAALDTSVAGAYRSIEHLSREQWYLGGILRSVHRYSADAFVLVLALHIVREWLCGHYRGFRRFSWLTGVPLLPIAFMSAIGGFWLTWDQLGQFSASAIAEWLDWLPLFGTPLARNFLNVAAVSNRLFSLFVFIHIGAPLLLTFGLWFHIQRISHAAVFPPRALTLGVVAMLLTLALVKPVLSQPPADLAMVPSAIALDWLLLFIHPLTAATSAAFVWLLLSGTLLLLFMLPFLPQAPAPLVAEVDSENCNGCRRCFADCPYAAIAMIPHPERMGKELAQVDADLCASCGICAGACPSSTPFRSVSELRTGIDMPQLPIGVLRTQLENALAALRGDRKVVVFGCDRGADVRQFASIDVATLSLFCIGMLPPSFVDYALRNGATGVLITGCREGSCEFRLGTRWTEARLAGEREPHLRASVPDKLCVVWADPSDERMLQAAIKTLQHAAIARVGMTTA